MLGITSITTEVYDQNTLSGSADKFRNALGMYWRKIDATLRTEAMESQAAAVNFGGSPTSAEAGYALEGEDLVFQGVSSELAVLEPTTVTAVLRQNEQIKPNFYDPARLIKEATGETHAASKFDVLKETFIEPANTGKIIESFKFPVRLAGNPNSFYNDDEWLTFLLGGGYYTSSYPGVFGGQVFDVYAYKTLKPYAEAEIKEIYPENYFGYDYYQIRSHYNHYYPIYEAKAASLGNDRLLPNMYFLDFLQNKDLGLETKDDRQIRATLGPGLTDFIGVGADPNDVVNLMTDFKTPYLPPYTVNESDLEKQDDNSYLYLDRSYHLRDFLNVTFRNNTYPDSARTFAQVNCQNLIFTDHSLIQYYSPGRLRETSLKRLPMYISIEIPRNPSDEWAQLIAQHDYEDYFMSRLKEEFSNELYVQNHTAAEKTTQDIKNDAGGVSKLISLSTNQYRCVDLIGMLTRAVHEAQNPAPTNEFYMEPVTFNSLLLQNPNKRYRYGRTIPALKVLKAAAKKINHNGIQRAGRTSLSEVPKFKVGARLNVSDFWHLGSTPLSKARFASDEEKAAGGIPSLGYPQLSETIAYRIEKTRHAGATAAGGVTQDVQNIFYFNSNILDNFVTYYDSQVQQDTDYTYRVFEYRIVQGYRYKYTDLRSTRLIANQIVGGVTREILTPLVQLPVAQPLDNCLEFFEVSSGKRAPPLAFLSVENAALPLKDARMIRNPISGTPTVRKGHHATGAPKFTGVDGKDMSLDTAVRHLANRNAGTEQVISTARYLADFYVHVEPSVRIIETLIAEKTTTVSDSPPVAPDVTPYQHMDDSQVIGFYINQEAPIVAPYPTPLDYDEEVERQVYLTSRGLAQEDNVQEDSASPLRTLEVYRIDYRPNAIADFDGSLVYSKDLSIKGYEFSHKNCFYEEKVATNKKYYYLFRYVSANGVPGRWSPIQVAELINDGGYKYAEFDVIYESSFQVLKDLQVSTPVKKLFYIPPSTRQTVFDDRTVDYSQPATTQFDKMIVGTATEPVWDKTFKIRLTSKKTGNKIDLNVTYRLKDTNDGFSR